MIYHTTSNNISSERGREREKWSKRHRVSDNKALWLLKRDGWYPDHPDWSGWERERERRKERACGQDHLEMIFTQPNLRHFFDRIYFSNYVYVTITNRGRLLSKINETYMCFMFIYVCIIEGNHIWFCYRCSFCYFIFTSDGMAAVLAPKTIILHKKLINIYNQGSPDSKMKLSVGLVTVFDKGQNKLWDALWKNNILQQQTLLWRKD